MDFSKYEYPSIPMKKGVFDCSCGHTVLLKEKYKFCPMCGNKCITSEEEESRFRIALDSYYFQVKEIQKQFQKDMAEELGINPSKPICFNYDELIKFSLHQSDMYEDVFSIMKELLDCKK